MNKKSSTNKDTDKYVDLAAERLAELFIEQAKYNRQYKNKDDSQIQPYIEQIKLHLSYSWEPVLFDKDQEYHYPMKISLFMKEHYRLPAIYRWDIYKQLPEDNKKIYIGEAAILCPRRIQGYLTPGPSQETNKRLKDMFDGFIKDGFKIRLSILKLQYSKLGKVPITINELSDKFTRRYIEAILIVNYSDKGYTLLNL
ncbi:MAG: hypothetical protein Q8P26_04275 [Candidatus Levybacteria bacterium]|nr:hypothetical protein [Candidatus Levybacteria bacterium]